ncbi:MAG TPA: MFS transporter [Magnetospirillaceae bacterium]|nr:MFS transporter [Magnetospirillaceae bacterium]
MSTKSRAVFTIRDFRLLLIARGLSSLALPMVMVAVGWHVYDLTRDPLHLGYVGLTLFLPQILLTLPAGHVADLVDRRLILIATFSILGLCAAALCTFALFDLHSVAPIFGVLVIYACANSFLRPASTSLVPMVVPKEHLPSAVAWNSSVWQMAGTVGPAVGGVLYGFGPQAVYGTSTVLMLTSVLFLFSLSRRPPPVLTDSATLERLLAGVKFVWHRPMLLGAISLDLFAVLLGGATALLPVYARDILAVGPWGLGLLRSAPAVGAVTCGLWLAHHPLKRPAGRTMFLCVAGFGVGTIIFGLSRFWPLSLLALMAMGACDMVSVYVRQNLVQLNTPDEMRGRVSAVTMVFIGASNELGEFESGVTASWFGVVPAVVLGGIGTLLVVAVWSTLFRSLRRVDRLDLQDNP